MNMKIFGLLPCFRSGNSSLAEETSLKMFLLFLLSPLTRLFFPKTTIITEEELIEQMNSLEASEMSLPIYDEKVKELFDTWDLHYGQNYKGYLDNKNRLRPLVKKGVSAEFIYSILKNKYVDINELNINRRSALDALLYQLNKKTDKDFDDDTCEAKLELVYVLLCFKPKLSKKNKITLSCLKKSEELYNPQYIIKYGVIDESNLENTKLKKKEKNISDNPPKKKKSKSKKSLKKEIPKENSLHTSTPIKEPIKQIEKEDTISGSSSNNDDSVLSSSSSKSESAAQGESKDSTENKLVKKVSPPGTSLYPRIQRKVKSEVKPTIFSRFKGLFNDKRRPNRSYLPYKQAEKNAGLFYRFPAELMHLITRLLPEEDFYSLKRTCKALYYSPSYLQNGDLSGYIRGKALDLASQDKVSNQRYINDYSKRQLATSNLKIGDYTTTSTKVPYHSQAKFFFADANGLIGNYRDPEGKKSGNVFFEYEFGEKNPHRKNAWEKLAQHIFSDEESHSYIKRVTEYGNDLLVYTHDEVYKVSADLSTYEFLGREESLVITDQAIIHWEVKELNNKSQTLTMTDLFTGEVSQIQTKKIKIHRLHIWKDKIFVVSDVKSKYHGRSLSELTKEGAFIPITYKSEGGYIDELPETSEKVIFKDNYLYILRNDETSDKNCVELINFNKYTNDRSYNKKNKKVIACYYATFPIKFLTRGDFDLYFQDGFIILTLIQKDNHSTRFIFFVNNHERFSFIKIKDNNLVPIFIKDNIIYFYEINNTEKLSKKGKQSTTLVRWNLLNTYSPMELTSQEFS